MAVMPGTDQMCPDVPGERSPRETRPPPSDRAVQLGAVSPLGLGLPEGGTLSLLSGWGFSRVGPASVSLPSSA